jgi:DNA polymerase-1
VLMILDGNNLGMRSFHAAKGSMSSKGEETGALHLFVTALAKYVRDERPDRLLVVWDSPGGSLVRQQIYSGYKASRRAAQAASGQEAEAHRPLFRLIKQFLHLAGVEQWQVRGFEADDLIAGVWRVHRHTEKIVILSSDKDMLQLLDENTEQVRFSSYSAPTDRWTRTRVITDMGCRPEQIPLMMALTGDSSDGVPGMRGIGPKKALKMLDAANWDLDKAMAPYPEHYSIVKTSQALVDLAYPATMIECPEVPDMDLTDSQDDLWVQLLGFCQYYELSVIEELLTAQGLWSR